MIFLEVTVTGSELTGRGVGCMRQPGCRSTESTLGDGRYWAPIPEPGPRRRMSPPTLPTVRQQIDTGTSSGVVVPPPTTTTTTATTTTGSPDCVLGVCPVAPWCPAAGLLHPTINKWGGAVRSSSHHRRNHHHHHSKG